MSESWHVWICAHMHVHPGNMHQYIGELGTAANIHTADEVHALLHHQVKGGL